MRPLPDTSPVLLTSSTAAPPDNNEESGFHSPVSDSNHSHPTSIVPTPVSSPLRSHSHVSASCFVHSHIDQSLANFREEESEQIHEKRHIHPGAATAASDSNNNSSHPSIFLPAPFSNMDFAEEEEEEPSLTRQLAETAVSVREMSKQLGRARVKSQIESIMIITKARDNHLIKLTRKIALYLMLTPRESTERGIVVYVDSQLRNSKRFDAAGIEKDHPHLFRPIVTRRSSRNASSTSLKWSLTSTSSSMKSLNMNNGDSLKGSTRRSIPEGGNKQEGQLRYWTAEMCAKTPHLYDLVITLGGDGTVLFASWLFQTIVPPIIPFSLGSLGFLTNFEFSDHEAVLDSAIDSGVRVNLRMRFTCTIYRAVRPTDEATAKKRVRAVRSGKTGEILMENLRKEGWEALENGGCQLTTKSKKDREVMCFSTRPTQTFEILNDLVVDRGFSPYVSLLELFGDEHHMTTVQADGLCVATPTGSTAYSLSAGGSLVHPEIPAFLISPICPHTLSFRPMLLPDSMELRILVPYNSRNTAWASFDGRNRVELKQGDHIKITASPYPVPTVCKDKQSTDWFHAISRTLKWNERQRQKSFVVVEEKHALREEKVEKADTVKQTEGKDDDDDDDDDTYDIDGTVPSESEDSLKEQEPIEDTESIYLTMPQRNFEVIDDIVPRKSTYDEDKYANTEVMERPEKMKNRGDMGERDDIREPLEKKAKGRQRIKAHDRTNVQKSKRKEERSSKAEHGRKEGDESTSKKSPGATGGKKWPFAVFERIRGKSQDNNEEDSTEENRAFAVYGQDASDTSQSEPD